MGEAPDAAPNWFAGRFYCLTFCFGTRSIGVRLKPEMGRLLLLLEVFYARHRFNSRGAVALWPVCNGSPAGHTASLLITGAELPSYLLIPSTLDQNIQTVLIHGTPDVM